MILVTGATGNFGPAAIDFLLKKIPSSEVIALIRDESKAKTLKSKGVALRIGDYEDLSTLRKAMEGVEKVLLVSGPDLERRQKQHENVIDAAKAAGVKFMVYTSFLRKTDGKNSPLGLLAETHLATEQYLKASGLPFTILKNSLYADVLPMFFGEQVLQSGIYLPADDGKAGYATREEMAEVAANILLGEDHEYREYIISNIQNYSLEDAAAVLSEVTGLQIPYHSPTQEEFTGALRQAGVQDGTIEFLTGFCGAIAQGEFETEATDMQRLLGRKPMPLKDFLKRIYTPHPG